MKLTNVISISSLLVGLMAGVSGQVRAQSATEPPAMTPPTTSTTTTTTTPGGTTERETTVVVPVTPVPSNKTRATGAPSTTNVEVNTPSTTGTDTTTTKVRVDAPPDAPNGTTNVEITTPPAAPAPKSDNVVVTPEAPAPAPTPVVVPYPVPQPVNTEKPIAHRVGAALTVGGGVVDFTGASARDMTNTGGYWNARIISGTRQFLGVEAAYTGSARDISALGLSNQALLVSNGIEGAFRLNVPLITGRSIVEPFAFAGLGWSRYNIARSDVNTSSVASSDDIMEIPYGGGLSFGYGGFLADARFTYRSTYYNDMFQTPVGSNGRLNNWSVGGQLGAEF